MADAKSKFPIQAVCEIAPKGKPCGGGEEAAPGCTGTVLFLQKCEEYCEVQWNLSGCGKEGLHGFHVHEKADFSNGCMSAGPHFNPMGTEHGDISDNPENRHVGDLGNIIVDKDGNSRGSLGDTMIKLDKEHDWCIVGRSVMVHADPDDLGRGDRSEPGVNGKTSHTTGNAGARIGCGEIVLKSEGSKL